LSRDFSSKVIEQQAARIARIETQMRQAEKFLKESLAQDRVRGAWRFFAILVGLPLGIAAFLYIGVLSGSNHGRGLYIGIVCGVFLWLISRTVLGLPHSNTPALERQILKLHGDRVRAQEGLKKYVDESPPDEVGETATG